MKNWVRSLEKSQKGYPFRLHWFINLWLFSILTLASANGQDLSGYWQGIEHDTGSLDKPNPTSLTIVQNGSTLSGYFYQSLWSMDQINVLFAIENGQFANYTGSFEINVPIKQTVTSGGHWCTGSITFTYNPDRERIVARATYRESDCQPSVIELTRANLIAKEPFCSSERKDLFVQGFDVRWYADAERQVFLHRGNTYQPLIDTTTTFYITQSLIATETPAVPLVVNVNKVTLTSSASINALCTRGEGRLIAKAIGKEPLRYSLNGGPFQSSPTFDIVRPSSYSLTVEDSLGCQATQLVELTDACQTGVYVPTAFSPNGDGVNDELTLWFAYDSLMLEAFSIFDRWGGLLYSSNKPQTLTSGQALWSSLQSSEPLLAGVYTYQLQVVTPSGERFTLQNSVTVVK